VRLPVPPLQQVIYYCAHLSATIFIIV